MIVKFRETKLWKSHWSEQKNGKIAHEAEINVYYLMTYAKKKYVHGNSLQIS